jgi:CBS domain-containing protein
MREPVGPLSPDSTLADAARLLADRRADSVLVVAARTDRRVVGIFTRRDLVVAYGRHMEKLQDGGHAASAPPGEHP